MRAPPGETFTKVRQSPAETLGNPGLSGMFPWLDCGSEVQRTTVESTQNQVLRPGCSETRLTHAYTKLEDHALNCVYPLVHSPKTLSMWNHCDTSFENIRNTCVCVGGLLGCWRICSWDCLLSVLAVSLGSGLTADTLGTVSVQACACVSICPLFHFQAISRIFSQNILWMLTFLIKFIIFETVWLSSPDWSSTPDPPAPVSGAVYELYQTFALAFLRLEK